ncbi:unnamed protein product [Rhodiola kirilowii]
MEADPGKLFIAGIAWNTTVEKLREYFGRYGEVLNASIAKDKSTGRSRGFGFVSYSDASVVDRVLKIKHVVDDRTVVVKQALLREENDSSYKKGHSDAGVSSGFGGSFRTKKIFVGGLPTNLTEDAFRQYFGSYGLLTDAVIMHDRNTSRPRGFGFISFEDEDSLDRVLSKTFHELNGKLVEVKRAQPKEWYPGGGRSDVHGRGFQLYGPSGSNRNRDPGQSVNNNFAHLQNTLSGFPPYGYGTGAYYGYYGFGGYAAFQFGFGGPLGSYQPPFLPVGYASTSYGAVPVLTSQYPNGIGYENQGNGGGSYFINNTSSFSEHSDDRAQSKNVSNIGGGGGDQGKGDINHDDLRSNNSLDAGHETSVSRQTSADDSNVK